MTTLPVHVLATPTDVARAVADDIASQLGWVVRRHGSASVAFSGGSTPWHMLGALARHPLPWSQIHVFQVDERAAPDGHPDRNIVSLRGALAEAPLAESNIHAISILEDLTASAEAYAATIAEHAPNGFDVVHLGLGADGHTASLLPDDPALDVTDQRVAVTGVYQGWPRITLTYPELDAAHHVVWMVDGAAKAPALRKLLAGDTSIPGARVATTNASVFCDRAAVTPEAS